MSTPRYLTKSRFKLACECPRKLYYTGKRGIYHDALADDEFLRMLADGGHQVGALAKLRYPDGIEISEIGHAAAEDQTRNYLTRDHVVLFEPAIRVGDFFVRIDILVKSGNHFELIEVKAKSYNSAKPALFKKTGAIESTMLPYFQDAAFQTWVLQQAYPGAQIDSFLMMPDKAREAPIDGINQMFKIAVGSAIEVRMPPEVDGVMLANHLLAKVDITQSVADILADNLAFPGGPLPFAEAARQWAKSYAADQPVRAVIGAQCAACQFKTSPENALASGFKECWKEANGWVDADFAKGTVLDIWNCRRKEQFMAMGIYKMSQVQKDDLGEFDEEPHASGLSRVQRQWFQVHGLPEDVRAQGYYFDTGLAREAMAAWRFPYHFIDFETASPALPLFAGMKPYQALAFQFSHHALEASGDLRHAGEFLCADPGAFPNYAFARSLMRELSGDSGTVFMWSNHENTILASIANQLTVDPNPPADKEELVAFLMSLTKNGERAMVDLCYLAEKAFFHPDTKGRCSIKKVLPAVLRSSPQLQARYSKPVYGAPNGIPSRNFASTRGFAWIDVTPDGAVSEPYAKLKEIAHHLLPEGVTEPDGETSIIAEGGAAATAYARLQCEDMSNEARMRITSALLRYCELDTLAMAMVTEAWLAECQRFSP